MAQQAEKVFLINLDRSVDRLAHMQQQFDRLGMTVERVPAAEGLNIPAWMQSEFKGAHQLSPGEVGCYASHLMVAHKIVAERLPYAVALEDDAVLDDDFLAACADAVQHAPDDWDLIHLSAASSTKRPVVGVADLQGGERLFDTSSIPGRRQPTSSPIEVPANAWRRWSASALLIGPTAIPGCKG